MCGPTRRGCAPAQRAVQKEYDVQQPFTFLRLSGLRPLAQDAASCLKMLLKLDRRSAAVAIFSLAFGGSSFPATPDITLPRNVVVPLSVVSRFFPEIIREASTGRNLMATGNPKATRIVIY